MALTLQKWITWGKVLIRRLVRDDLMSYAAAMAYNLLFAFFPLLLFVSALIGFLHLSPNPREVFSGPLSHLFPKTLLTFMASAWRELIVTRHPTLLSLGAVGFVWGMSGAFRQLIDAINHAYEFPMPWRRPLWKTVLLSLVTGLGVGLILSLAVALVIVGPTLIQSVLGLILHHVPSRATVTAVRWIGLVSLLWFTLTILYAVLPDRPQPLRWFNPGTLAALLIWLAVSLAFSFYIDHFNTYARVYGSLGTIILLMLYLYFAGLALVIGAEVTALSERGLKPDPKQPKDNLHD